MDKVNKYQEARAEQKKALLLEGTGTGEGVGFPFRVGDAALLIMLFCLSKELASHKPVSVSPEEESIFFEKQIEQH